MLVTSINMRDDTLRAVSRAAVRLGKTRRDVIVMLLLKIMTDARKMRSTFTTVKYQPHVPDGNWRAFCIRFRGEEYEFFTDMRKHCKISVSFLVAIAVKRYLAKLIVNHESGINNYCSYHGYLAALGIIGGIHCWISCWGRTIEPGNQLPSAPMGKTRPLSRPRAVLIF